MRFKEQSVRLPLIDSTDDTYRITTDSCLDRLAASIKTVGVLNPPLLIKSNSGYTIISGFRRIQACRDLEWSHMHARLIEPDTEKLDCVKIAITDNALQRPLNLIETSRSLNLLSGFFENVNQLAKEAALLVLPESPSVIEKIRTICHLPVPLQNSILSERISLPIALELGRLDPNVSAEFVSFFDDLPLSLSKQREMITLVKEIAAREDISILEVLRDFNIQEIRQQSDFDKTQKAQKIRSFLRQRRFPAIAKAEQMFKKHEKRIRVGAGIKLIPPDNFESAVYTVSLNFKNLTELKDRKAKLEKMLQHPSLEAILDR